MKTPVRLSAQLVDHGRHSDAAMKFARRINAHDVDGLIKLMTPDHCFIDSLGTRTARPAIEDGWRRYFEMVPDYWISVERMFIHGDVRILVGRAGGTYVPEGGSPKSQNKWEAPAVWLALIRGKEVAEWRIYSDNEPVRQRIRGADS